MPSDIAHPTRAIRTDQDQQSLLGYILQGAGFMAFLLGMMVLAGWRG